MEQLRYIDTHTHFYDTAFDQDHDEAIARAIGAGVVKMVQPDVDSRERDALFELTGRHKGRLFPMLGLYPGSVGPGWQDEVEKMLPYLDRGVVAIGEIGLDYHYSSDTASLQRDALRYQLELAARLSLPVNIHLRDATADFLDVLSSCAHLGIRGALHAFSGSYETFREVNRRGDWSVGIGGVLTFKNSRLWEAVQKIPLEKILLETDSPYLAPVPYRGRRNESAYIPVIARRIAEVKGVDLKTVADATTSNAEAMFGI